MAFLCLCCPVASRRCRCRSRRLMSSVTLLFCAPLRALYYLFGMCSLMLFASSSWRYSRWFWRPNSGRYQLTNDAKGRSRFEKRNTTTNHKYETAKRTYAAAAYGSAASSSSSASASVTPVPVSAGASRSIRRIVCTIHGYLGLPRPFMLWRGPLTQCGYTVVDFAYDSGGSMDEIADGLNQLIRRAILDVRSDPTAHAIEEIDFDFICHSMGGLVLRTALNSGHFPIPIRGVDTESQVDTHYRLKVNRIVMIATPNQGSEYGRTLAKYPALKSIVLGFAKLKIPGAAWLRGLTPTVRNNTPSSAAASISLAAGSTGEILSCGDLLMTRPPEWFRTHIPLPRSLYPRTLAIAGTLSLMQGFAPATSDGTVQFAETKLPDPIDQDTNAQQADTDEEVFTPSSTDSPVSPGPCGSQHMSFHAQHSLLLTHAGVIAAAIRFIQTGRAD